MAEIWKPQPNKVYQEWIDTILDEASDKLTTWEVDFLDSVEARLTFGGSLTERQAEILEKMYAQKTK